MRNEAFEHATTVAKDILEASQEKLVLELADFSAPQPYFGNNSSQLPLLFTQFVDDCLKNGLTE